MKAGRCCVQVRCAGRSAVHSCRPAPDRHFKSDFVGIVTTAPGAALRARSRLNV
jgi:hypothetical protein